MISLMYIQKNILGLSLQECLLMIQIGKNIRLLLLQIAVKLMQKITKYRVETQYTVSFRQSFLAHH